MKMPHSNVRQRDDNAINAEKCNCCCPSGCVVDELIDNDDPEDAVRVVCSNSCCIYGPWMHQVCFDGWEHQIVNVLRNSGKARGLTDKQRQHNLWTKRGYDLAYRACECRCGHGYLKKDTNYAPPRYDDELSTKRRQRRKNSSKQMTIAHRANSGGEWSPHQLSPGSAVPPPRMRSRTMSLGSAAGLNAGSDDTPPDSPDKRSRKSNSTGDAGGYFHDNQVRATGSIFKHRDGLGVFFENLPRWKVNGFHIKMEDDCPQGNDDTRIFLLTNLGGHNLRDMTCLLCAESMPIYDRYPLVDGTFFLSPVNHAMLGTAVRFEGKDLYLSALCIKCLEHRSNRLCCLRCGSRGWFMGDHLTLGGLYTYDILSTSPCCPPECRKCHSPMPLPDAQSAYMNKGNFSTFSEPSICAVCGAKDMHYIRRLDSFRIMSDTECNELSGNRIKWNESVQMESSVGQGLLDAIDMDTASFPLSSLVAAQSS